MRKIGLTGSIGAGKSAAARYLRTCGVPVHDADVAVHDIYTRPDVLQWLGENYPGTVQDGAVNRARLAQQIYVDPEMRKYLECIIHPLVRMHAEDFARAHADAPIVVFDTPLLFETGRDADMDESWLITAPLDVRRTRVMARDDMPAQKFEKINAAQMAEEKKKEKASVIIENNGTLDDLHSRLQDLIGGKGQER